MFDQTVRSPGLVLCYVRPWNAEQFVHLAREAFPDAAIAVCSEHRACDHEGLRRRYFGYLGRVTPTVVAGLDSAAVADMIARCRLLRALPEVDAKRHLFAMAQAINDLLADRRPEAVLSLTIDSYIIDLLHHFSRREGIPFVGLVPTFVNGFFRVTARGEVTAAPRPDFSAIEVIRSKLLRADYIPSFIAGSVSNPRRGVLMRWAKNLLRPVYFALLRRVGGDRFNYHYWASQLIYTSFATALPPDDPGAPDWAERMAADSRTPVYLPLQMFPECTVDYWCEDVSAVDYYAVMQRLIDQHHKEILFVIKEHPAVMGQRPRGFYDRLRRDRRVLVVPTYTPSNVVLEKTPAVLVWTGTVGFEAALRGKAVLALSRPFYASGQRYLYLNDATSSGELLQHIRHCSGSPCSEEEQDSMLRHLVGQLCPGTFLNDGSWRSDDPQHVGASRKMAATVRALHAAAARPARA